ncbi:hypothetical protein L195_g045230 [Trifolium pratense]|uniref:Uncharacterized protein n=1 Tax=Trifolium pratense TaxID=57577 RepID=A0A2K3ME99_TRIPR|nr:hypothetical protein L195_g045230 [Trifolium pratense]
MSAQKMWNRLRDYHEGTGAAKIERIDSLTCQSERFRMKPGENIQDMENSFEEFEWELAAQGENYREIGKSLNNALEYLV